MSTHPTLPPLKECGCGAQYSLASWRALPLHCASWDVAGDGIDVVEMRHCTCRSTICVHVDDLAAYPDDFELEDVSGAFARGPADDSDRADFASEDPGTEVW